MLASGNKTRNLCSVITDIVGSFAKVESKSIVAYSTLPCSICSSSAATAYFLPSRVVFFRCQGRFKASHSDENRMRRTAKSRFPLRALLFSLLSQSQSPNEKSWRARPATARSHSLASSLALRRTSQLVAGGRLDGEHVTLENGWKKEEEEEKSVSHTKWFDRRGR